MTTMLQSGQALAARYYLLRRIGSGRSGEVWLARDSQARRDVALKILSRDAAADPRARARFLGGAELQREFAGPQVVTCEAIHHTPELVLAVYEARIRGDAAQLRASDWPRAAGTLIDVAAGLVNLIPFNPFPAVSLGAPPAERFIAFSQRVLRQGQLCMVRWPRGREIAAACGQLVLAREGSGFVPQSPATGPILSLST